MNKPLEKPTDVKSLIARVKRPKKAVITAGMPYANGPLHIGHLGGAHVPADIYARWMRLLIGDQNVLFVCGTDDHGSTSEVAAIQNGLTVNQFIEQTHAKQKRTMDNFGISLNVYTGTSRPETLPHHTELCQDFIRKISKNGMLNKKTSKQWYDTTLNRFLQDRNVSGKCPNPHCTNEMAYSDECEICGNQYDPSELINPKSALSKTTPELRDTVHWWLDMWKVSDVMREWLLTKENKWRTAVYNEVINTVLPSLIFENKYEPIFKELRPSLPKHKSRYAPGKKIVVQFDNKTDLAKGQELLKEKEIVTSLVDGWAHRSITRDVTWGVPLPLDVDPEMTGKSLYVWPDSLIAPISFSKVALKLRGESPEKYKEYWNDPEARVYQFLGQDNIYFYVLMQGAMWLGTQNDPMKQPALGELQFTEIFGNHHLMVDGEKMSKSRGNFYTGDQMLDEKGYSADQVRYFLALLTLPEKSSSFDFPTFHERNKFLAGPMNAAFEKPISAVHARFEGKVPDGKLLEKAEKETMQIVQKYLKCMEKGDYSTILFQLENYARLINSFFTQFKPHDDRFPLEERKDALYSCFYILKNMMIMLSPFAPFTMEKLRNSLNLSLSVLTIDELGTGIPAGHEIKEKDVYFPAVGEESLKSE